LAVFVQTGNQVVDVSNGLIHRVPDVGDDALGIIGVRIVVDMLALSSEWRTTIVITLHQFLKEIPRQVLAIGFIFSHIAVTTGQRALKTGLILEQIVCLDVCLGGYVEPVRTGTACHGYSES